MRPARALSIGLTATLAMLACGDESDGSLGGVSGGKLLSDLSAQETLDVCRAARERAREDDEAERGSCLVLASVSVSLSGVLGSTATPCRSARNRSRSASAARIR
jgi:hypothetical protein